MPKKGDRTGGDPLARQPLDHCDDIDLLAAQALGFLAADTGRLQRFIDLTGLEPSRLRQAAAAPGFAMAVMTYICADESLLVGFAEQADKSPDAIGRLVEAASNQSIGPTRACNASTSLSFERNGWR